MKQFNNNKGQRNTPTSHNEDYEVWLNEAENLEYIRIRPKGLEKLASNYRKKTGNPAISVVEFKTDSDDHSFDRNKYPTCSSKIKEELGKLSQTLGPNQQQGMLFCVTGKDGKSIHTIPFLVKKDASGSIKILDFENHLLPSDGITAVPRYETFKANNYSGAQISSHGCGTFALDTLKNCLTDTFFLKNFDKQPTLDLPKMVLGQGQNYIKKLSADKKSKYVVTDTAGHGLNRKSFYKSHHYAQLLNPEHLQSLKKKETLELILHISEARSLAKSKPLSFDQWLKQKWGVVSKNENTSQEARGIVRVRISDGSTILEKLPIVNYCFDSEASANRFADKFNIRALTSHTRGAQTSIIFQDRISQKHAVAVQESDRSDRSDISAIKQSYAAYRDGFKTSENLATEQQTRLDAVQGFLNIDSVRTRVDHIRKVSRGDIDGDFPHLALSGYKAALDAYIALNYQDLSKSEIDELEKRAGWLFGYDKAEYGSSASFSGLKAEANFLHVIGGLKFGLYDANAKNNPESVRKIRVAAIQDASCQIDGVGRRSDRKKSAPGYDEFQTASNVLVEPNDTTKWKVVPRLIAGNAGDDTLIPETNRVLIEGGGTAKHSFTAQYWWKAKTQDNRPIETKLVVDKDFLLGKDQGSEVRGAEVLLWKIPDTSFWIKKEDYGVESFCAVDESGKRINPQPISSEIARCVAVLKNAKYDYYRTEYNGGAGLHWAEKQTYNADYRLTSGQGWIPYTVKIEPHHKMNLDGTLAKSTSASIAEDIKARIVAERMSKLYNADQSFMAGSNPNDPASAASSTVGDAEWRKWHVVIEPIGADNKPLERMVPEYSKKMAIQHSGNCAEINKFYALLGIEDSAIDTILQEFRNTFVKHKNTDKILTDIEAKRIEIAATSAKPERPSIGRILEEQQKIRQHLQTLPDNVPHEPAPTDNISKTKEIFAIIAARPITLSLLQEALREIENKDVIEIFSNKDDRGNTILHNACIVNDSEDCFSLLLERINNAEATKEEKSRLLTTQNNKEETPLHLAADSSDVNLITMIVGAGGLNNFKRKIDQRTPLHITAANQNINSTNLLIDAVKQQGTINNYLNDKDKKGDTPLHLVVMTNDNDLNAAVIKSFISAGVDLTITGSRGLTAEQYSTQNNRPKHLKAIQEAVALLNSDLPDPVPETSDNYISEDVVSKLPSPHAANAFNDLEKRDQSKILNETRVTITEAELEHARKFLALIAITGGEFGKNNNGSNALQRDVYIAQNILPKDYNKGVSAGLDLSEKIEVVSQNIKPEHIKAFYQRLIEKRPLQFIDKTDIVLEKKGAPKRKFGEDLNLEEYVGYSEMEIGAMLQVFGPTHFINDGGRKNAGKPYAGGIASDGDLSPYNSAAHEDVGYISAITGMRFETTDPAMERVSIIAGEREKAEKKYRSEKTGDRGDFAKMKAVTSDFVNGHKLIWDQFYKADTKAATNGALDEKAAEYRLYISYKKFLAESIANAQKDGAKAYIRVTGIGDGVWADGKEESIQNAIGKAVRRAFDDLSPGNKSMISAIEFSQFSGTRYYQAFNEKRPVVTDGVEIISKGAQFANRLPAKYKSGKDKSVLCVNFAWDSGSYVGNEYWNKVLTASGDPAAACCSSIAISMNPDINHQFLEKLHVVSKDGKVCSIEDYKEVSKPKPEIPKPIKSEKDKTKKHITESGNINKKPTKTKKDIKTFTEVPVVITSKKKAKAKTTNPEISKYSEKTQKDLKTIEEAPIYALPSLQETAQDNFKKYFSDASSKKIGERELDENLIKKIQDNAASDEKILYTEDSKEITAKEAAELKLGSLLDGLTSETKDVILKLSASSIVSKAMIGVFNDEVEKEEGKRKITQEIFVEEGYPYKRHMRCSFDSVNFSESSANSFGNSFANCEFTGICDFSNISTNLNKFSNCVFTKDLKITEPIKINEFKAENFSGCKFSPEFIESLGDKKEIFKKYLNIEDVLVGGFYEIKPPSPNPKPVESIKLKTFNLSMQLT